jgi:hypothetical protein
MRIACTLVALALTAGSAVSAQRSPSEILDRAIAAAGGRLALEAATSLQWDGTATIHIPNRTIEIAGHWQIVPPDSAVVSTYPVDQGPGAVRRMILSSKGGLMQRGDAPPADMPPELLTEERHQFYLYYVLRLVPLLDSAFALRSEPADSLGSSAIRVTHPKHPDVVLYFDEGYRVSGLRTVFASADMSDPESQLIRFRGLVESNGVRWFREMDIDRAAKDFFDLRVAEFLAGSVQDVEP